MLAPLQKFAQSPCLCYRRHEVKTRGNEVNKLLLTSLCNTNQSIVQNLMERSGKRMCGIIYNKHTSPILK